MELKTSLELFYHWEKENANKLYLAQPHKGVWEHYSWSEAGQEIRQMAAWLKAKGFERGSRVALLSKNCAHWLMADLAIQMAGYVSVPIYPNVSAETVAYVLDHSGAEMLFVGKLDDKNWQEMKEGVPTDMECITFPKYGQKEFTDWDDTIKNVERMDSSPVPDLDEMMTIIYTSGTTGTPKGVVHHYRSPAFAIGHFKELLKLQKDERFFSYLPLSHIAERMLIEMGSLVCGGSVHFAESLESFVKNLGTCQPTVFLAVPRIWTKFQMGILANMPPKKLNMFLSIPILSGIVKKKIKEKLGLASARICFTGAAPIPTSLLEWYSKLGIEICNVYGMTENSAYSHANIPGANRFGSVGQTLPGVEFKLGEEDEICLKSPVNMVEYYKMPEKTAEDIRDGWFHTGDCGREDEDGYVFITGRIKDIFKTSKAKYVAPSPIELKLSKNPFIEQVCVVGTGIPQPIALVVLSEQAGSTANEELLSSLGITLKEVNPLLEKHERLQKIIVVKEAWTVENNLMTPTLKIKRNEMDKCFGKDYEGWYEGGKGVVFCD